MARVPPNIGEKRRKRDSRSTEASLFTEDERDVAEILLQLPILFPLQDSRFLVRWGATKRRSAIDVSPSRSPEVQTGNGGTAHDVDVDVTSPITPLSFSPSEETDSKSKQSTRKIFKKKTNKELKDMAAKLSGQREQLKQEIAKVRDYCEGLKAENLKLKEIKLQLGVLHNRNQLDLNSCRNCNDLVEQREMEPSPTLEKEEQQPLVYQPSTDSTPTPTTTARSMPSINSGTLGSDITANFQYPYSQVSHPLSSGIGGLNTENHLNPVGIPGLNTENHLSALGIPDLNFSAEETATTSLDYVNHHTFDLNRAAIAAQARKRRIEINRMKNSMALKPRFR